MGDQSGDAVKGELSFVPLEEFDRLLSAQLDPVQQAEIFAALCRINTLYMVARAGSGHLGSSFSSLDIVSWLYLHELGEDDLYFSSKGHDAPGLYSALIGLGRLPFDKLHQLRRLAGLPGHPDVSTPGMVANTGSLGMGISKAKGMILANRLLGRSGRVFVMTGDGELQEGQIWESLGSAANRQLHELTVIVDHNKLQSDTLVSSVSDLGDLERKFEAFGWSVERCDGNDVAAFAKALAREVTGPRVVIADTVKGRGVSFMEHTSMEEGQEFYRFHSGAPSADLYHAARVELVAAADAALAAASLAALSLQTAESAPPVPAPEGAQRLVGAYSDALIRAAHADSRIVALDADLILDTGLIPFRDTFPDRLFECGIAEQDMVSQAAGMARNGLLPVVHSFACFLSTRPNEQIYNNATERRKIVYVGSLAGLVPGGPGHSHQSVRDISAVGGVPGLVLIEPSTQVAAARATEYALADETTHSTYLRLTSVPVDVPFASPDEPMRLGRGSVVSRGDSGLAMTAYSPVTVTEAWRANELLRERTGRTATLIDLPFLNRLDVDWFAQALGDVRTVLTIDNHYVDGGQGSVIAARAAESGLPLRLARAGVSDVPAYGTPAEVLGAHGLDAASLADRLEAMLGTLS
jgi:transketolase